MKTVAVLVGSVRKGSINQRFARALAKLAEDKLEFRFVEIGDLPMYNDDLWADLPAAVTRFKAEIEAADAVLMVTPEYNRSFTPLLMNAITWGSRPYGKGVWVGKPAAITGTTPGVLGTAAGQNALRTLASAVGLVVMTHPEVYWTSHDSQFDGDTIVKEDAVKFLSGWADAFARWIDSHGVRAAA